MTKWLYTWTILLATCAAFAKGNNTKHKHMYDITAHTPEGNVVSLEGIRKAKATVFVLLAPECPISQLCTQELNALAAKYSGQILLYGVFPGNYYTAAELLAFRDAYKISFPLLMDTGYTITDRLYGSITPQAFVISNYERVLYSGAVDNSFKELGKKSALTTMHYLADALAAIEKDMPVKTTSTKAIGCLLERQIKK